MILVPKIHSVTGLTLVEIHNDRGEMVGCIYPTEVGIKIVSPNFVRPEENPEAVEAFLITDSRVPVPQFDIPFGSPGPYAFANGRIVRIGRG